MKQMDNKKKQLILWAIIVIVGLVIAGYFFIKSNQNGGQNPTTAVPGQLETEETTKSGGGTHELETEETTKAGDATHELETEETTAEAYVVESQEYSDKDHVAAYLHEFGHLPPNYITKAKADSMSGWQKNGYYIGGDHFGNYEGLLPKKSGRKYYECDVDYSNNNIKKGNRGTKRLIYSNDGLIFYTSDHYESFTQLYGD